MGIGRAEVEHVAKLARLALTEQELELFEGQLSAIIEHARTVTALDTEGVSPTFSTMPMFNVFRPDEPRAPLTQQQALANAPRAEHGLFRVPRILDADS
ncbi:MAG: Asp-tRNA(Asn)/Glu-tRNA(Gln) amidotransferase subunit GatC [Actinomycetota bacterium]